MITAHSLPIFFKESPKSPRARDFKKVRKKEGFAIFCVLCVFFVLNASAYRTDRRETVWDEIMFEQSVINMRKGAYYMESENYVGAANEFIKAISKNPNDANAHIFYGSSLYWLGDIDKALREYETALKFDSKNALALQLMAIAYSWRGEMDKALKYFLKAEKYGPGRSDIKMNLGSVFHSLGRFDKSLFYFRKALKLAPKNPLYNFQLGILYKRLGRYYDALSYMNAAARYDRIYEDAFFELGTIHEKLGNKAKAISAYKRALYLKPLDSAARFRLAVALLKTGELKKIKKYLIEAFNLIPKNKKGGISLNLVYSGRVNNRKQAAGNRRQETGSKPSKDNAGENDILNSIENSLKKIKDDEDIKLKVEFLSLPKTLIINSSREKRRALSNGLNKRFAELSSRDFSQGLSFEALEKEGISEIFDKPKVSYERREYFVSETNARKREENISEIISEIDKILSKAGKDNDVRISIGIETNKRKAFAASENEFSAEAEDMQDISKVAYNPRMVGNDMRLWVKGQSWLENVQEGLIELEDFLSRSASREPISYAVMGLGNLILGETVQAEDSFEKIRVSLPLLYNLGMSVMWVEKGNEKKALYHSDEVLKIDSKNKVALRNKKWLTCPIHKE